MAYGNYRGDWNRDRNERWRSRDSDEDDSRRARDSMERDYYGSEMSGGRGGYGGWRGEHEEGPRFNRDYGRGDYGQQYGQGGRDNESSYGRGREYAGGGRERHYGNEMGGWQGREDEQWRNRDVHGQYDTDANYGGFSSSGTGNYRGHGGSGGSYQGGQSRWGEAGMQYSQSGGGASQGDYNYRGYERGRERYGQQRFGQGSGQQEYGTHRGRGPHGYKRSDDRIREDVCDCLTDDDRLDATHIEVMVKDGEVTLSGFTTSRADKRWAESLAERISGVKEVQNGIRLLDPQRGQAGTQTSAQGASGTSATGTSRSGDKGKDSNIQH